MMAEHGLSQQVTVRNFHRWRLDQLKLYHVPRPPDDGQFWEALVESVIHAVDRGQIPAAQYGAVLIDEGHDFRPDWLKLIAQMVRAVQFSPEHTHVVQDAVDIESILIGRQADVGLAIGLQQVEREAAQPREEPGRWRMRLASSRQVTSLTSWTRFSMPQ
jgi:hypothetical protein